MSVGLCVERLQPEGSVARMDVTLLGTVAISALESEDSTTVDETMPD